MVLTNIDKFIEALMWMWNSPETAALFGDLKLALDKQGLAYKDGKIIKSQRRISAETKENGYDESEDEKIRKKLIHLVNKSNEYGGYALHKWEADEMLAWLEKQGQKPINDTAEDIVKAVKDASILDMVGPKFKVGDWVVHDISDGRKVIRQIINMTNKSYILDGEDFNTFYFNDLENDYHLWTIQDAKPGDVLAFDDETIVIFKDLYNATTFHSYCHIEDGLFDVNKDEMPDWWEGKGFHPATKKQRDLFFQKMKEEGYKWDDEKKELKKIEEELQLKEGKYYECIKSYHYLGGGQYWFDKGKVYFCEKDGYLRSDPNNNIYVYDCKNWQSCFRPYTEKHGWSKEDEENFKGVMDALNFCNHEGINPYDIDPLYLVSWLESIKNRIGG